MDDPTIADALARREEIAAGAYAAHIAVPVLAAEVERLRGLAMFGASTASEMLTEHRRGCAACRGAKTCDDGRRLRTLYELLRRMGDG